MAYTMLISYFENGKSSTFDVSQIVHNIEYTTSIDSQPGKLTFNLEKDTSDTLQIALGSIVQFFSNGKGIFYGKVFTIETDITDVYRVVAYDPLRYFKNSELVLIDETYDNICVLFDKIIKEYNLKGRVSNWTSQFDLQPLESHFFSNKSLFDIMKYYMESEDNRMTLSLKQGLSKPLYKEGDVTRLYLRCNYNVIELREIQYDFLYDEENRKLKDKALFIGDESLMTNYEYKIDIDNGTFNRLIFVYNQQDKNSSSSDSTNTQVTEKQMVAAMDAGYVISNTNTNLDGKIIGENTISKWGILSNIIELKNIEPSNQLEEYMKACLEVYSNPTRTLKINAMGNDSIFAGSGFYLHLSKLDVNYPVYALSVTHRYDADKHTMEMEVATNIGMRKFL